MIDIGQILTGLSYSSKQGRVVAAGRRILICRLAISMLISASLNKKCTLISVKAIIILILCLKPELFGMHPLNKNDLYQPFLVFAPEQITVVEEFI